MSKHTTAPWIVSEYGDYGDYDGECRVVLGEGGDIRTAVVLGFDTPENRANARLIAAAPELLSAAMLLMASRSTNMCHRNAKEREAYKQFAAAIAKAEGGAA